MDIMSEQKYFLKSIRYFLEKSTRAHAVFGPAASFFDGTRRRFGLKIPQVPQWAYFQLLDLCDRYPETLYQSNGFPSILFYSPRYWNIHAVMEHIIAIALSFKGARCIFSNCEGRLPICNIQSLHKGLRMPCDDCMQQQKKLFHHSGLPNYSLPSLLSKNKRADANDRVADLGNKELEDFSYDNIPIGKLVQISTRWFLAGNNIMAGKQSLEVYKKFITSAILVCDATKKLLETTRPDVIFLLNGLFFEERIVRSWAQRFSIPTIIYENGLMKNSFVFARNKIACYYDLSEHWPAARKKSLAADENKWLDLYLADRQVGKRSVVQYWPKIEDRLSAIKKQLGLKGPKKIAVAFSNIVWDSAVQERDGIFDGLFDWLHQTISFFVQKPEYQFIVRVHPAEVQLKGRETEERTADYIQSVFPELPENITIVLPQSEISSYRLIELANLVLTYSSTVGLEAALMGKLVQVAGQTHYRERGFTIDPESRDEYFYRINSLLKNENSDKIVDVEIARRYAYLFFKKYMIDFSSIIQQKKSSKINLMINDLADLKSNPPAGLSAVVDFILQTPNTGDQYSLIL